MSSPRSTEVAVAPIAPAVLAAALLVAQQVAAKATRDGFFLSQFDVTSLPPMSVGAAILSLLAVLGFARGMAAVSPVRFLPLALAGSALLLVLEWGLSRSLPRAAAAVFYLHTAIFGATLVSGFWSLVNERFDPYSAKRAMGPIGAGASLGGVIGGLTAWGAASSISIPTMLLGLATLNLLSIPPILLLRVRGAVATPAAPAGDESLSGLRLIRELPYLQSLAALVALCAFLEALLDYVFSAAAAGSFAKGGPLLSFFALFHTGVGLLTLAVQSLVARPLLTRLGIAGTLAVLPGAAALGGLVALAAPRLVAIVLLRGSHAVLRNSLFRSAYELLYTPLSQARKRPTKVIVDVGFDRLGTALGSGVVMWILAALPSAPTRALLALAAVCAGLLLMLTKLFRSNYVAALADRLRTGAVTLDAFDIWDASSLRTLGEGARAQRQLETPPTQELRAQRAVPERPDPLAEAVAHLRSEDRHRIRGVLGQGPGLNPRLVAWVIPLLARDDLFGEVLASLRGVAAGCTGQLVDALLDPLQDPLIRRRIPRVLRAVPTQRAVDGLLAGLKDDRLDLRYRCAQALARMPTRTDLRIPRDEILKAARREIADGRPGKRSLEHVFAILSLILEREPLQIALSALRTGDDGLRGTALEYLDNVLPSPLREELWPWLGAGGRPAPSGRSTEEIRDNLLRSKRASSSAAVPTDAS